MSDNILADLVNSWEECDYRDCIVGWTICFQYCLSSLVQLLDEGYIRKTGAYSNEWCVLPTEAGIQRVQELGMPRHLWYGTIAKLNSEQ